MLLEAQNVKILSDESPKAPPSEASGLAEVMESFSGQKVLRFFMKLVAMGKQEGAIHRDPTEEVTMLYLTIYKNELGRYWEARDQERLNWSIDPFIELFYYGLAGQMQKPE